MRWRNRNDLRAIHGALLLLVAATLGCAQQRPATPPPSPPPTAQQKPAPTGGLFAPLPSTTGAFWLGNVNARLPDVPTAMVHNANVVAVAFPTGVVVFDRVTGATLETLAAAAPLALSPSGLLVASTSDGVVVADLRGTTPLRRLKVGGQPTVLSLKAGRLSGAHAAGVWACDIADFGNRSGEMFWGPQAPQTVAVDGSRALFWDKSAQTVTLKRTDGTAGAQAFSMPAAFVVEGGAINATKALVFGTQAAKPAVCWLKEGACVSEPMPHPIVTAAIGKSALLLDDSGQLWEATPAARPKVVFAPGQITAPHPTFSVGPTTVLLSHDAVVTQLTRDAADRWVEATPVGHRDRVTGLSFSPEADSLFSVGLDGTAKQWTTATGTLQRSVPVKADLGGVWDVVGVDRATAIVLSSPDQLSRIAFEDDGKDFRVALPAARPSSTATLAIAGETLLAWGPRALHQRSLATGGELRPVVSVRLPRHPVTGGALRPMAAGLPVRRAPACPAGGLFELATGSCTALPPRALKARHLAVGDQKIVTHGPSTWVFENGNATELLTVNETFDGVFVVDRDRAAIFVGRSEAIRVSLAAATLGTVEWRLPLPTFARLRTTAVSSDGKQIARAGVVRGGERRQMEASRATISLVHVDQLRSLR